MQTNNLLQCVEVEPASTAQGTIIWLHGLGADGNDFVPIIQALKLPKQTNLRFVFPNAPTKAITVNNGYIMQAWYDIFSLGLDQRIDYDGINQSIKKINDIIEHEENRGISADRIVLAGFSQGAVIALAAGLNFPKRLAGLIALSGYFPFSQQMVNKMQKVNRETPIFFGHGTHDLVVPYAVGQHGYELLKQTGFNATWHSYPIAHGVNDDEIADIAKWLIELF